MRTPVFLFLVICNLAAFASEGPETSPAPIEDQRFKMRGFITADYFNTTHNNWNGESTKGSWDAWEVGAVATYRLSSDTHFSSVIMARDAGKTDNGKPRLDQLLVDTALWRPNNDTKFGAIAGRLRVPIGFYNETRDVASTRPSIVLPQAIYFDNARNYFVQVDGAVLYLDYTKGETFTRIEIDHGRSAHFDSPEPKAIFLGADWPGNLKLSETSTAYRIYHTRDNGNERYNLYFGQQKARFHPAPVPPGGFTLDPGKFEMDFSYWSFQKALGAFELTSETIISRFRYRDFGVALPDHDIYPLGSYLMVNYHINDKWESFGRYEAFYLDKFDRKGKQLAAASGKPEFAFYERTWGIGTRYHLTPSTNISMEYYWNRGTATLSALDNPISVDQKRNWNLFAVQFTKNF